MGEDRREREEDPTPDVVEAAGKRAPTFIRRHQIRTNKRRVKMISRAISLLSPTVVIDVCQRYETLSLTSQGEHLTISGGQSSV